MPAVKQRPLPQRRARTAMALAIASGKGGVGKTWLSVTLAAALARSGKRTLLVDCDLGLANVDVQLGVRPTADLHAVVRGWVELEAATTPILGGAGGRSGGFDLIPGHSGSGALAQLPGEEVMAIIQGLRRIAPLYDVVLLDQAAGIDPQVMRFSRAADRAAVVVTEEPTSLTDGYAFVKVLRLADPEAPPPWVVVNMAENRVKGRGVYDQFAKACEKYLGFRPPLAGVICRDTRVPDAIRAQTPLPVRHPQSQAFDDVMRIADALTSG